MRVFCDENIPRPLRSVLTPHELCFVEDRGWKGIANGDLLGRIEREFDCLLTADTSLTYQKKLLERDLSVVVVPTNDLTILRASAIAIKMTLDELEGVKRRALVVSDWRGKRTIRNLSAGATNEALAPMPPFGTRRH